MTQTRSILAIAVWLNLFCVLFHTLTQYNSGNSEITPVSSMNTFLQNGSSGKNGVYRFINPPVALKLLEQLDIFGVVTKQDLHGVSRVNFTIKVQGYTYNDNYCDEHRAFMVEHPAFIFKKMNFVTNYWFNHKLRTQIIPSIKTATDLVPQVYPGARRGELGKMYKYDFPLRANHFYMFQIFFKHRQVGKHYSCLSQQSNHIPGHDKMARKDHLGQSLVDYAKKYETRSDCFNYKKYFPQTWLLQNKEQCREFFTLFRSENYQQLKKERKVVFFRKIGADVHEGKGVFPVTTEEERNIRKAYKNGKLCGQNKFNNLIQMNVHNLLLVTNRKFGFRMFLLIASVNPVIAYYHDGYVRLSLNEYDPESKEKGTFVTNIGVNIQQEFRHMTHDEIQEFTSWSLDKFHQYLMEQGTVTDKNWLDNYLRPEFKKVMIHLLRMAESGFLKVSSVYELFGIDFVMDEDLNLWFIEANAAPLINGFTKETTRMMHRMLRDTFEIEHGLLRSRMKRVINYINRLTIEDPQLKDLEGRREEFKNLIKNSFEPEFEPSPHNTFDRIIDETKKGVERYSYLLPKRCL